MEINVYINQKKLRPDSGSAINEFVKRLSPYCKLNYICGKKIPVFYEKSHEKLFFVETGNIHIKGKETISSPEFAELINNYMSTGISSMSFFVGYESEPLADVFSVSTMTLSTEILSIALAEQIYRAFTINNGITYHK